MSHAWRPHKFTLISPSVEARTTEHNLKALERQKTTFQIPEYVQLTLGVCAGREKVAPIQLWAQQLHYPVLMRPWLLVILVDFTFCF